MLKSICNKLFGHRAPVYDDKHVLRGIAGPWHCEFCGHAEPGIDWPREQDDFIAVISSSEKAFSQFIYHVAPDQRYKYVWIYFFTDCEGLTFTRVIRTCNWFGDDLLDYCEGRLRACANQ